MPAIPKGINRRDEVTIHQLRTGTSSLVRSNWARYNKLPETERYCPNGCAEVEDVEHIVWKCPSYAAQRMKHFGATELEHDILFKENPRTILKYIDDIGHSSAPTVDYISQ